MNDLRLNWTLGNASIPLSCPCRLLIRVLLMLSVASPNDDFKAPSGINSTFNRCPTCCPICSRQKQPQLNVESSTFVSTPVSFSLLLAAGTLTLPLKPGSFFCSHFHAEDGFHGLDGAHHLRDCVEEQDVVEALSFLIQLRFVQVTYALAPSASSFTFRIYLVPFDLPGSGGVLRRRDETRIMRPARAFLRKILPRVSTRRSCWDGRDDGTVCPRSGERLGLFNGVSSYFPNG